MQKRSHETNPTGKVQKVLVTRSVLLSLVGTNTKLQPLTPSCLGQINYQSPGQEDPTDKTEVKVQPLQSASWRKDQQSRRDPQCSC